MAGTPLTRETVENTPTGAVEFDPSLLIGEDEETPVEVPTDPIVGAMGDEGAQAIAAYFQAHPEDAPTDEAWQAQFGQLSPLEQQVASAFEDNAITPGTPADTGAAGTGDGTGTEGNPVAATRTQITPPEGQPPASSTVANEAAEQAQQSAAGVDGEGGGLAVEDQPSTPSEFAPIQLGDSFKIESAEHAEAVGGMLGFLASLPPEKLDAMWAVAQGQDPTPPVTPATPPPAAPTAPATPDGQITIPEAVARLRAQGEEELALILEGQQQTISSTQETLQRVENHVQSQIQAQQEEDRAARTLIVATITGELEQEMGLPVEIMMEVQNMAARMQNIPVLVNGGMSFEEAVREGLRAAAMNVPAAREAIVQGLVASTVQKEQQQISEIQQRNDRKTRAAAATSSSSGGVQELPVDVRTMAPDARMNAMADAVRAFQQG